MTEGKEPMLHPTKDREPLTDEEMAEVDRGMGYHDDQRMVPVDLAGHDPLEEVLPDAPPAAFPTSTGALIVIGIKEAKKLNKILIRKTPKEWVKSRQGPGNTMFRYSPWQYTALTLTQAFGPTWSLNIIKTWEEELPPLPSKHDHRCEYGKRDCKIPEHKLERKRIEMCMQAEIVTPLARMPAFGSGIYFPANKEQTRMDAMQAALSQCTKRAGAKYGIAVDAPEAGGDPDVLIQAEEDSQAREDFIAVMKRCGLTERSAVSRLSQHYTKDPNTFTTLDDVLMAAGAGPGAYNELSRLLEESFK